MSKMKSYATFDDYLADQSPGIALDAKRFWGYPGAWMTLWNVSEGMLMAIVVLLRGVNVGGHRTFRPTQLAKQLSDLDVVNIGAAGTFVVRQPVTQMRLRAELARRLPFDTEIMLCHGRDILALTKRDHFAGHPQRADVVRFVSVLSKTPSSPPSTPATFPPRGKWMMKILAREKRFVLGVYRRQMKAVGYLGEIDRFFGMPATTRNWNTVAAIARALGG